MTAYNTGQHKNKRNKGKEKEKKASRGKKNREKGKNEKNKKEKEKRMNENKGSLLFSLLRRVNYMAVEKDTSAKQRMPSFHIDL